MADREAPHKRLVLPGPVEVRPEILDAQTQWMIGHRSPEFAELFDRVQAKLRQIFLTEQRVFVFTSSGSGVWEATSRNCIREGRKVLHLTSGAFSERWAKISTLNGKDVDTISVDWGKGFRAEMVADALKKQAYDAVCVVHNETSTGVLNPIKEIGEVVAEYDDTLYFVDTVSGILGAELRVDDWGIDVALTSSQKAFSLPPGLAFGAVSDKAIARAEEVENRGYYFDFLELEKRLGKSNTPATPPISILFAADQQMTDILEVGLESWWTRHAEMRDITHEWLTSRGLDFFAEDGFRSPTVTAVKNTRGIDVFDMAQWMYDEKDLSIDKGYGKIKGDTFRVAHMGDMTVEFLEEVLAAFDEYLKKQA